MSSNPKIPDSDLHKSVGDTFFKPPASPPRAAPPEDGGDNSTGGESGKGESTKSGEKAVFPAAKAVVKNEAAAAPPVPGKKKKVTRRPLMTYFSEENYDAFEEMYIDVKRRMRQDTGKKLAETHVTEIAVMLAVEEYNRNPEKFIERFKKKIQL